jgi:hypothetical protein
MNKLELKEYSTDRIVYLYTPEGKGEAGEVVYYNKTGEAKVSARATEDEFGRYGHNAGRKIREFISDDYLPVHAIQAWH